MEWVLKDEYEFTCQSKEEHSRWWNGKYKGTEAGKMLKSTGITDVWGAECVEQKKNLRGRVGGKLGGA